MADDTIKKSRSQLGVVGKVVVVTGASSGIGAATAQVLAAHGARVVLGARRADRLAALVQTIEASGGRALAQRVDVTVPDEVRGLVGAAVDHFGRVDVLVNNAGTMPMGPLDAGRVDEWDRCIDINIKGVLYGIAAVLPHFRRQGSGHLITIASIAGLKVMGGATVYCATKHAVRAIAEGFRQEAGPTIRSTLISPGAVESELAEGISDPAVRAQMMTQFEGIHLPAETIGRAVLYAISQPDNVDIGEIVVRPTAQDF